jgi:hypothetical protein
MNITITRTPPKEWEGKAPIESYETTFLSTGFSRYNTAKQTLSQIVRSSTGVLTYTETPCDATVFSRTYASEDVRVLIYSRSPRVWKEEIGLDDAHYFVQQPTQTAFT